MGMSEARGTEGEGVRLGRRPARAHSRQAEGCSRAGKGPRDPTAQSRSSSRTASRSLGEIGVFFSPIITETGEEASARPWCLVTVYILCVPVSCLLPPSLSHLSAPWSLVFLWTETYCSPECMCRGRKCRPSRGMLGLDDISKIRNLSHPTLGPLKHLRVLQTCSSNRC